MASRRGDDARAAGIRAFIAIELDAAVRDAVAALVRGLRTDSGAADVRWMRPENLHVTLRFLGQTDPSRVPDIVRQLRRAVAGWSPFPVQLGAVVGFPSPRRPRVIACEVGPAEPLAKLAQAVARAAGQAGCEQKESGFRAHLTLGRISGRLREPVTAAVTAVNESWLVEEIALVRSRLTNSGAIHTPLERIALGGSDHP